MRPAIELEYFLLLHVVIEEAVTCNAHVKAFITFFLRKMDTLSYKYYGDANYGWLIMQANPQYGSMEFSIPDGVPLRIPYPLSTAKTRYEEGIQKYKNENT